MLVSWETWELSLISHSLPVWVQACKVTIGKREKSFQESSISKLLPRWRGIESLERTGNSEFIDCLPFQISFAKSLGRFLLMHCWATVLALDEWIQIHTCMCSIQKYFPPQSFVFFHSLKTIWPFLKVLGWLR